MNYFIAHHPEVAIVLLTFLVSIIGSLLGLLLFMFKRSLDNMAEQLQGFTLSIGSLLDRMQRQETICEETRKHCPAIIQLPKPISK